MALQERRREGTGLPERCDGEYSAVPPSLGGEPLCVLHLPVGSGSAYEDSDRRRTNP